ncbi:FKBP-type peptidyl-prolyl cis-trans isomerase [bacterium]|nr:FKBP-type peptidyl-prolyl cis-trans isomerase [bacterium]
MKKLTIVVLFALLAASCGGSDDTANTDTAEAPSSDAVDAEPAETADGSDTDDADDGADGTEAVGDDDAALPAPGAAVPVQVRDCAHSLAELEGSDDEDLDDVVLPPDVKPEVSEEFLGPIDELIVTDMIEGSGREAVAGATVEMEYVGVLGADGTEFDSSWDPDDAPFSFPLGAGRVIVGWDEGIAGMKAGGRRVLQIPSAKAYGEQARSEIIVANSDLVFIVDLISVIPPPEPAPPIDDENLGSFGELQIIDLVVGEGCTAESGDIARVNYVGVDAVEGAEFDSSWGRGALFQLIVSRGQVIEGWNEGIVGMNVGGERILQIPADLAYGQGDLVFRVHLEELIEAPTAHTIEFEGDAPDELQISTLVEGSGEEAAPGSIVDAQIVVMLYKSGIIVQSTYQDGAPTQLALQEGALLPGLEEGILGVKVGETRQIILPPEVAYPTGATESGIDADDALVFFIEPVRVVNQ